MIELSLETDFSRMERMLQLAAGRQTRFAAAQALNDVARAARDSINAHMGEIFDRPTPFTMRSVVAPREDAAEPGHLVAGVKVRPVQSKYLLREETGGTRSPADNTRKASNAIVLPGRALLLNDFGNIPAGVLRKLSNQAKPKRGGKTKKGAAASRADSIAYLPAGAPANKAHIGGFFRREDGGKLSRLTVFEAVTHYQPRFHYRDRVAEVARARWAAAFRRRLGEAIATAR